MRMKILKIYAGIFIIGTLYLIWLLTTRNYIPCFYYMTTGLLCPVCGVIGIVLWILMMIGGLLIL